MREIIKQQLEKVERADLSNLSETEPFIIPKYTKPIFDVGKEYIIELSDDLLIQGKNDILEINYNHGKTPGDKVLRGEVESNLGKLILFVGFGYSTGTKGVFWRGYLPKEKLKIIKKIG